MNEPIKAREPWACGVCGATDNETRFHNLWELSLSGETPAKPIPEVSEEDMVAYDLEVCDRCAQSPYMRLVMLSEAVREEIRHLQETVRQVGRH